MLPILNVLKKIISILNNNNHINITDLVDNFEIIFLKDGIYKTFDIDLKDGDYDYSFEWNDGEIFN